MDEFGMLDLQPFSEDDLAPPAAGPMPKGDFNATLQEVKVEEKENGVQLLLQWGDFFSTDDSVNGDYSRRKIFQREWIIHSKSPVAQTIGRNRLTQAGKALGLCTEVDLGEGKRGWALPQVQSAAELGEHFSSLVGAQCTLYVNQKKRSDNDELENTVGSVKVLGGEA